MASNEPSIVEPLRTSLLQVVTLRLGSAFELALKPSLRQLRVGPNFVQALLEPVLTAQKQCVHPHVPFVGLRTPRRSRQRLLTLIQ
jgi:hypothetical protein